MRVLLASSRFAARPPASPSAFAPATSKIALPKHDRSVARRHSSSRSRRMPNKILCVAEKPSISKAVAHHLSGGTLRVRNSQNQYIKNYDFKFRFPPPWGECNVTMTAVLGHTIETEFAEGYRKWHDCSPSQLFDAPITQFIKERTDVESNIKAEARHAKALYIWTDCDREGEYIGTEVRDIALKVNPGIEVKRARFSNIERAHILSAAQRPGMIDERQAQAVAARIELDLRIGAAFTRWQTLLLNNVQGLDGILISYGSCQFPTLGFVVDRWRQVKNFVPEQFWSIKVVHTKEDIPMTFHWDRNHLFDRLSVVVLFERCLQARIARISAVAKKPTRKSKPLPLTTVELQKLGSRFMGMSSAQVMSVAEKLYTAGWISYPRTETDQFDNEINLRELVSKQTQSTDWGGFAQGLLNGGFQQPRAGRNNDHAHPPIHPVNYVAPGQLSPNENEVYKFVVRRFLACCSEDAIGESTTVNMAYGDEGFHATGLVVVQRNYLDVYPYDRWESSQPLPRFAEGEQFVPQEATITDGKTTAPGYLTEPELIALMDANGIGTDATMAEHITKIKDRQYVFALSRGGGGNQAEPNDDDGAAGRGRGRGRGGARGRGRGRGGAVAGDLGGRRQGADHFVPSSLGIALVEGYDQIGFENSLSKPFLRKEMEQKMKQICEGTLSKRNVVESSLEQYRDMFIRAQRHAEVLKRAARTYVAEQA